MVDGQQIVTKAEFARACNVSPGRVSQWIASGHLQPDDMVGTGRNARIKLVQAKARLAGSLDTAKARNEDEGGTDLTVQGPALPEALRAATLGKTDLDKGMLLMGLTLGYQAGALTSVFAASAGAPMKTAFLAGNMMTVWIMSEVERMTRSGMSGEFTVDMDAFDTANWEQLASEAGEPVDMEAWKAFAAERDAALAAGQGGRA